MRTHSTVSYPRRLAVLIAMVAMLMPHPVVTLAGTTPATPELVACHTPPIDELRYAEATTDTGDDVPIPEPIPYRAAEGTPADAATVERVEALVGQVVACVNEGRIAAFLSLFTSGFLERHAAELGGTPDDDAPEPVAEDMRLSLVGVANVVVLDGGRITTLVVLDQAEREAPELTSVLTLAEIAGRLLIDEWQPVTIPGGDGTPIGDTWERVDGEGYTGVIVPVDEAPAFAFDVATEPSGYWLPDADLIAELEEELPGYLRSVDDDRAASVAGKVGEYGRQYAGLVVDGRAVIYVNALCDAALSDGRWTSAPLFVADGGDCFFQVQYEPATGEFRELRINGEA